MVYKPFIPIFMINLTLTKQLENELRVARAELEATRATQAEEQATLKMALMRGVCALNMETMSLFHRDTRSQTEEVGSGDVLNQNAHNWTNNGTLLVGNQDTYTTQFLSADGNGLLSGPCGIPVQKRTNDFINRIGELIHVIYVYLIMFSSHSRFITDYTVLRCDPYNIHYAKKQRFI